MPERSSRLIAVTRASARSLRVPGAGATLDVVDAHVARLASNGDHVLTSDPGDIARLLAVRKVKAVVTRV